MYGSQGDTIAENAFIWASEIKFHMQGPQANRSGVVRLGHVTLNSLFERDQGSAISLNDLLKSTHTTIPIQNRVDFTLNSAVVNHDIVNQM